MNSNSKTWYYSIELKNGRKIESPEFKSKSEAVKSFAEKYESISGYKYGSLVEHDPDAKFQYVIILSFDDTDFVEKSEPVSSKTTEENNNYKRIVIVDHTSNKCFIEDVDIDELNTDYNGSEKEYIEQNYFLDGDCIFDWDFIVAESVNYTPSKNSETITIDFSKIG